MARRQAGEERVERYRTRIRLAGFRLVQLWIPDTRAEGFAKECGRQSRAANRNASHEEEVLDWVESTADADGWTAR